MSRSNAAEPGAITLATRAAWRLVASLMNQDPDQVDAVTAHVGGGTSLAAHRRGKVSMLIDAYSGLASTRPQRGH